MSVPDFRHVPQQLHATGLYDLRTHDGQGAFVDAVVATLHGLDERFGHLKKNAGQTAVHGHGEDSTLYLADEDGQSQAVDFVGGAGGPNPQPAWQVDVPRYSKKDWLDPTEHGLSVAPVPTPPSYPPYPGDQVFDQIGVVLFADYTQAGNAPDPQMGRWFGRTIYDWLAKVVPTLDASITKHRKEWRALLGLPPL